MNVDNIFFMEDFCDPVPEDAQRMSRKKNVFKIQSVPNYDPKLFNDVAMLLNSVIINTIFLKRWPLKPYIMLRCFFID